MGNFENIPELTGTKNYHEWRRQTENLLLGEGIYNHVSDGTDPTDFIKFASTFPKPLLADAPSRLEKQEIQAWIKADGLAKSIIMRKVSSTVLSLMPDDVSITARKIWELLGRLYDRNDISLQFSIRSQIASLKMKGAADAEQYVAAHTAANERLARMGVRPSDADAIYALLRGLPSTGRWPLVRKSIELEMQRNSQAVQAYQTTLSAGAGTAGFDAHTWGVSSPLATSPSRTSWVQS